MEELGLKKDNFDIEKKQYEEHLNERNKFINKSVILNNDDIEVK